MIKIDVEPYCSCCLDFEPDVQNPVEVRTDEGTVLLGDTFVWCKYRERCRNMVRYLAKQMEADKD